MSNRAHHRPGRRRRVAPEHTDLALDVALSLAGCSCTPDVTTRHEHAGQRLTVAHDDNCPAARAPSLYAIVPRRYRP